jgi:hypothetical protein
MAVAETPTPTMSIKEAAEAHRRAMSAHAETGAAVGRAQRALYRALRARFEERLGGVEGTSITSEQLAELGLPCEDCLMIVHPDGRPHEITFSARDGMTANCGRRL